MPQTNPFENECPSSELLTSAHPISSYEMAVLSTLFNQEDGDKVNELANQWGYQEEFLYSVWAAIHANIIGHEPLLVQEPGARSRERKFRGSGSPE